MRYVVIILVAAALMISQAALTPNQALAAGRDHRIQNRNAQGDHVGHRRDQGDRSDWNRRDDRDRRDREARRDRDDRRDRDYRWDNDYYRLQRARAEQLRLYERRGDGLLGLFTLGGTLPLPPLPHQLW